MGDGRDWGNDGMHEMMINGFIESMQLNGFLITYFIIIIKVVEAF